jgi:hypothetical protein
VSQKIIKQLTAAEAEDLASAAALMGPFLYSQGYDISTLLTPNQLAVVRKAALIHGG